MNLADALVQLDRTEANLSRAEATWSEMSSLIPSSLTFIGGSNDGLRYNELARDLEDLIASLPKVGGGFPYIEIPDPDDLTQSRIDAQEIGELSILRDAANAENAPTEALATYRHSLDRARRRLVRQRVSELFGQIDEVLEDIASRVPRDSTSISDDQGWQQLVDSITEAERLAGSSVARSSRWSDLRRHIGFAQGCDAHDILENDWRVCPGFS